MTEAKIVGSVRDRWSGAIFVGKAVIALALLVGVGWVSHVITLRANVPEGVRIFGQVTDHFEAHASGIRGGRILPEPDPNQIVRYPLPDELRRAGVTACLERDGVLWYYLPSHPLDGGSPCLATPLKHDEPVFDLPKRVRFKTYCFQPLKGNWAYWFVLP
ncbi:hypothetical protein [Fimbriiglobus ruber]|uniref:hypothetical protein n=1 Tax=Fimbriiglobus ruber TaxID=1908690 RepID=UPI000B4AF0BF|nr:hypothetical protein [Fimbriiglobus ruber]